MKTRLKKSASQVPVPQTRADMENLLAQIAALKRDEVAIKVSMDDKIAAVKSDHDEDLTRIAEQLEPLKAAAETWATNNPTEFGKNKSIKMLHGTVGFRTGMPTLVLLNKKWNWKKVLEAVQKLLPAFIRNMPTLDKDAILAQREEQTLQWALPNVGLKVVQDESFFVETDLTPVQKREHLAVRPQEAK